jgi:hypothetical protein
MKELTWLGKCREQELDILIIFGLKIGHYFDEGDSIYETTEKEKKRISKEGNRIKEDLAKKYQSIKTYLCPKSYTLYQSEFQNIAKNLEEHLDHTYTLLTDPAKYHPPDSKGDPFEIRYNIAHNQCNFIEYLFWLKTMKHPNIPSFAYTLEQFLTLKSCFDNYHQLTQKQFYAKNKKITELEQENHRLKHILTSIEGFVEAIEFTDP